LAPKRRDSCFAEWWRKASVRIPKSKRKGFLIAWSSLGLGAFGSREIGVSLMELGHVFLP
jgi:hypothetical protein